MPHVARSLVWVCLLASFASAWAQDETLHEARWSEVALTGAAHAELSQPEGRTRWDLSTLATGASWTATVTRHGDALDARRATDDERTIAVRYRDPAGGDAAERWLLPQRHPAPSASIVLEQWRDGDWDRLWIRTERVGSGRLELPSGFRQVVLERALILRETEPSRGFEPESLVHRWIDPRNGVVAEVSGPLAADGSRVEIDRAAVVNEILLGGRGLRIYAADFDVPVLTRVTYGYDRNAVCADGTTPCSSETDDCGPPGDLCGVNLDTLAPGNPQDVWDIVCNPATPGGDDCQATFWDFSANTPADFPADTTYVAASTKVPIDDTTTCSWDECGMDVPGAILEREDRDFDDPPDSLRSMNAVETEDRSPDDVTIWLRGGVHWEGIPSGIFGDGETRLCHVTTGTGMDERSAVALWQFPHCGAEGCYMEVGDSWEPEDATTGLPRPFDCDNTIFVHNCGNSCGLFCPNVAFSCSQGPQNFAGKHSGEVIAEGQIKLPSGHIFDVLLARQVIEFCANTKLFGCGSVADVVRTVVYLWEAPFLGTVARPQSQKLATSLKDFNSGVDHIAEMDVKFGLFPPLEISVTGAGETTIDLEWDPGSITDEIDGYRVYWDTASGDPAGYAFNSVDNPGQVSFDGTSATVGGLDPGTQYFFTVTSLSDYTDPATCVFDQCVTTTYESLLFPDQMGGSPQPLPQEVSGTTTGGGCTPTEEVMGVTVDKTGGPAIEICWDLVQDVCVDGYQILGADSPEAEENFSVLVSDTGATDCASLDPAETYFLVVGKGSGGATGPWGHYGR